MGGALEMGMWKIRNEHKILVKNHFRNLGIDRRAI
jgi:hypothetical protein